MRNTVKCTFAAVMALLLAGTVFAQEDFDDFAGFGDSGLYGALSSVTWGGKAEAYGRYFPRRTDSEFGTHNYDTDNWGEKATYADASLTLNLDYSGSYSDFSGKLKFSRMVLQDYNEDILQEFTARVYLGSFQFEGGKMKLVWGKGDKVHVLDNFNANDYTDFIVPDYIDRRLAEYMFHATYNAPYNIRLEGVYTPWMTPDRLADDGMWQPAASATLKGTVMGLVKAGIDSTYDDASGNWTEDTTDALLEAASFDSDSLYPDTKKLKYGQAGLRATFTLGSVDLGASYYYGHYKQPSANLQNTVLYNAANAPSSPNFDAVLAKHGMSAADIAKLTAGLPVLQSKMTYKAAMPELDYDRVQVFGLEAATIVGPFNTRAEFAYNLTKDIAGDDPWVKNNSIAWEAGFDIDLPVSALNLNVQTTGKFILHKDKIKNGGIKIDDLGVTIPFSALEELGYANYDVDYDATGKYYRNQIIVDITDSYFHDNVKLDVKGIYQIETKDLMVLPSLAFKLGGDDFTLSLSGLIIWCYNEDSEYYAWRNNDFASVGIKYQF